MKEIVMRYNFSLLFSTRKTYNPSRPFAHPKQTYEKKKFCPNKQKSENLPRKICQLQRDEQRIHILYK